MDLLDVLVGCATLMGMTSTILVLMGMTNLVRPSQGARNRREMRGLKVLKSRPQALGGSSTKAEIRRQTFFGRKKRGADG